MKPTAADLEGRFARCCDDARTVPSPEAAAHEAFFAYLGDGSRDATDQCECGFYQVAHGEINEGTGRPGITSHPFVARGAAKHDRYYCGHSGWD